MFRKLSRILCSLGIAAGVLVAPPAQAKGPVTMTVEAGYGGSFRPGSRVPVTVVIKSTRAAAGELEVIVDRFGSRNVQSFAFEITGGGRKRFDLLVPAPLGEQAESILVRARDGKEVLARERVGLVRPTDVLIGFLGVDIPPVVSTVDLVPTGKRPVSHRVDEERAALGAPALRPLSHLIVDLESTERLGPAIGSAITGWVSEGGRLILIGPSPLAVPDWAPASWGRDPTATITSRFAGIGEVVKVPADGGLSSLDANQWRQVLRPVLSEPVVTGSEQSAAFQLANRLTRPRRARLELDMFFLFVLLYVVLVAPVNYLILKRRGRRELAWVTIPLLAAIFSGVAYGFARADNDLSRVHQASVSLLTDGTGVTSQLVALGAAARSEIQVFFPSRYAHSVSFGEGFGTIRTASVSGKGTTVELRTAPFSVAAAIGGGESVDGHLEAKLSWDGDGYFGTVTNRTRFRLDEVRLLAGPDSAAVGTLRPGQSAEVALIPSADTDSGQFDGRGLGRPDVPPEFIFEEGNGPGSVGDLLRRLFAEEFPIDRGAVIVTGVARGQGPVVKVSGGPRRTTRNALVASVADTELDAGVKRLPPSAVSWWLAGLERGAAGDHGNCFSSFCSEPGVLTLPGFKEATFGSRLPAGADPVKLRNGRIVVGTSQGVLKGSAEQAGQEGQGPGTARKVRPIPAPVPIPPGAQGESGAVLAPEVPPAGAPGSYRLQYWDWVRMDWVEGELWPGGKDSVPASAVSPLGEMYVKVIAAFEGGMEIAAAGIEWEVI